MASNIPEPPESKEARDKRLSAWLDDPGQARKGPPMRAVKVAVAVIVVAVLGYFVWQWAGDMAGVRREAPKIATIIPLPPPPPPPPEPEQPPPEPEQKEEVAEPEPEPEPEPIDQPTPEEEAPPSPSDDLADPMQMDADAQAGSDAFNIGAGQGRGMSGSGGGRAGNATYSQYLAYALQKILREDDRTRNLVFRLQANIWLTASGQVERVELVRSSGDPEVDARVIAALRAVPALDERPPASVTMPVRASLNGRRPS